jgi:CheY-like chemotaxis protein
VLKPNVYAVVDLLSDASIAALAGEGLRRKIGPQSAVRILVPAGGDFHAPAARYSEFMEGGTGRSPSPVLVVEDDTDIRDGVIAFLELKGHRAVAAADGPEALRMIAEGLRPSAVILDLFMPSMDGWEFTQLLKGSQAGDVPIIVVSAHPAVSRSTASLGVAAALEKPIDPAVLEKVVRRYTTAESASR